jgi:hypothetical protein
LATTERSDGKRKLANELLPVARAKFYRGGERYDDPTKVSGH